MIQNKLVFFKKKSIPTNGLGAATISTVGRTHTEALNRAKPANLAQTTVSSCISQLVVMTRTRKTFNEHQCGVNGKEG